MSPNERVVIVGGPRVGKSTLALKLVSALSFEPGGKRLPIYCGDPLSKVKEPMPGVTYLPEGLPFSGDGGSADWIARNWFQLPGPWVMEGQAMARALRRYMENTDGSMHGGYAPFPCDRIIFMLTPKVQQIEGQRTMGKGIETVWYGKDDKPGVEPYYRAITEYRA